MRQDNPFLYIISYHIISYDLFLFNVTVYRSQVDLLTITELGWFTYDNPPYCYPAIQQIPVIGNQTRVNSIVQYATNTTSQPDSVAASSPNVDPTLVGPPQTFGPSSPNAVCNTGFRVNCTTYIGNAITTEKGM
jgi:hypothetical protein